MHSFMFPNYLSALVENFLEVSLDATPEAVPGFVSKVESCVMANPLTLFPLPADFDDVHDYFRKYGRRKKRSHVTESPTSQDFYLTDIPVYKKLHTLDDCGYYLALKQELAKDLVARHLDLDADREHAEDLYSTVDEFFHDVFDNSSKSPTDFPKYQPCMDLLEKIQGSMFDDMDAMKEALNEFSHADSMTTLMDSLTLLANTVDASDFNLPNFEDLCMWPLDYIGINGPDWINFQAAVREFDSMYGYFPTLKVSFTNIGDYCSDIYRYMNEDVVPHMQVIDDYLNEKTTKLDMSEKFSSLELKKALQVLDALAADFVSFGREFDQGMKSLIYHMQEGFGHIYNCSFPLINNDNFWNMVITKTIQQSGLPQLTTILNTYHEGASLQKITSDVVDQVALDYTNTMNELKLRMPTEIEEMILAITLMRDELDTYSDEIKMNQAFFM